MRRLPSALTTALLGSLAIAGGAAAQAPAPTLTTDLPCQVEGVTMLASGSGFTPNSPVRIQTDQVFETGAADATGAFAIPFKAPIESGTAPDAGQQFTLTATDDAGLTTTVSFRTVAFAFGTSTGSKSPKAKRTWSFSGFNPGEPVYGHFRHDGKSRGTYRFGTASAPCGTLKKKAAGIPIKGTISAGKWTVYVDQTKAFKIGASRQLKGTTTVYTVFRPRAASAAAYWLQ